MKLKIHPSAFGDLAEGRRFYERQGDNALGEYFFNTLFSDIDSLTLYVGSVSHSLFAVMRAACP
jgi:hypothetical protein